MRYADDFIVGFQYKDDGEYFHNQLQERLKHFELTLHETKTRLIEFGRFAQSNRERAGKGKPETFGFLGFVHICGKRRSDGAFTVHRMTIEKKQRMTIKRVKEAMLKRINMNVHENGQWLTSVFRGYYNYYGVLGNLKWLNAFRTQICCLWLKVLRRRSQKAIKYNWKKFQSLVRRYIPSVKTFHPYPNQRLSV